MLRWERHVPAADAGGLLRPLPSGGLVVWALRTTQLPDSGGLVGIDAQSGTLRFSTLTPSILSPIDRAAPHDGPSQLGSFLVTTGFDGQVYAFAPDSGRVSWVGRADSLAASAGGQTRFLTTSSGMAIATSLSGFIVGYRERDGSPAFTLGIGNLGSIIDRPVVQGDHLFVCNLGGQLASVRLGTNPTVEWTTSGAFPEKLLKTIGVASTHVIAGEFSTVQRIVGVRR
jgi:outer membrane protein assembly factor BamB